MAVPNASLEDASGADRLKTDGKYLHRIIVQYS